MTAKDFQSLIPGTALAFPYDCGSQCWIRAINPIGPGMTGGSIAQSGTGFVGLAVGTQFEIQFPSTTSTVAFQLWCGATPSRLEVYSSTGVHLGTRSLFKGPLGNGVIAFAAADIGRALLHHDNGEGLVLAVQWEGAQGDSLAFRQEPEAEVTQGAGVVFALTGKLRVAAEGTAELARARRAVARAVFTRAPGFVESPIIPSPEEQALGTVGSIWRDCRDAAMSAKQILDSEVATRMIETMEERRTGMNRLLARPETEALGPFEDVTAGKRRSVYVEVQYGDGS